MLLCFWQALQAYHHVYIFSQVIDEISVDSIAYMEREKP